MQPIVVSDILAVGEVPGPGQLEILAKAGFKSVVNCQLDGEVDRFPGSAVLEADAKRQGLGYAYAPVVSRTPSEAELAVFQRALRTLPSPIYAFCYSGARAAAAAAFIETEAREPAAIISDFAEAGFHIASLKPWLEDERRRHTAPASTSGTKAGIGQDASASRDGEIVGQVATPVATAAVPPAAMVAARELKSIVVHARAAGSSGFAVAG